MITKNNNSIDKMRAIIILVIGIVMSILIPTWQTPDEPAHLAMIGESINNGKFARVLEEDLSIKSGRIEFHTDQKINKQEQIKAMFTKPSYKRAEVLPKGVTIGIIKHFPALCGILLGVLIGLPTYWVLQLGEIFSLLFYTGICYGALKYMPLKKEVMYIIMISPIAVQQAGSIGYDCLVLSLSYFFISYTMYIKFEKETLELKDGLILLMVLGIITYIKVPYVFLGILLVLIPIKKIKITIHKIVIDEEWIKHYSIYGVALIVGIGIVGVYYFRTNRWIQILYGMITEWRRGIYLLDQTIKTWHEHLIVSSVGNFGWLDTPILYGAAIVIYVYFIILAVFNSDDNSKIKMKCIDGMVVYFSFFVLSLMILLSMVNHTIMVTLFGSEQSTEIYNIKEALYQIPYIGGLQGRYFLPFLPLPFIPLPTIKRIEKKYVMCIMLAGEFIIFGYVFLLILKRYWIA